MYKPKMRYEDYLKVLHKAANISPDYKDLQASNCGHLSKLVYQEKIAFEKSRSENEKLKRNVLKDLKLELYPLKDGRQKPTSKVCL